MNTEAIRNEITNIVTEYRRMIKNSRQHRISKIHEAKLNELGLGEFVGSVITGNSEAQEVIKQATTGKVSHGTLNAYGEGEEWTTDATPLFKLLNPAPAPVEPIIEEITFTETVEVWTSNHEGDVSVKVEITTDTPAEQWTHRDWQALGEFVNQNYTEGDEDRDMRYRFNRFIRA